MRQTMAQGVRVFCAQTAAKWELLMLRCHSSWPVLRRQIGGSNHMSSRVSPLVRGPVLGVIFIVLLVMPIPTVNALSAPERVTESPTTAGEILIAPFRNGPTAVTSAQTYSGLVTLTVSGIGQASATAYSDAFYILTNNAGVPVTPWRPSTYYNWLLWINGQHAENLIPGHQVPAHRSDHTYTFQINAPGGRLTFGVGDIGTNDNTGSYVISIHGTTDCSVPFFSQRDIRWREHPLRTSGTCSAECNTIGACGCTLASAAMVFAYYGANLTPATLSDCMSTAACPFTWATGATCSSNHATWINRYEFTYNRLDEELNDNGRPVILGMHMSTNISKTHWVLATSGEGNSPENYLVHDPYPLEGANTSLASLTRAGYVLDNIAVYDGDPVCSAAVSSEHETLLDPPGVEDSAASWDGQSGKGNYFTDSDATPDAITGAVDIYHVELTAVIVQLSATSSTGQITGMQLWTDSGPAPTWQLFSTLAWTPWQPGDRVHARFRDAANNVSQEYITSIHPENSPPPMPVPNDRFIWIPYVQIQP